MKDYLDNTKKEFTEANMFEFALDYFEKFCKEYSYNGIIDPLNADKFLCENIEKFKPKVISSNAVLKEVVCDLNIGDKVYTEGWGYKLDGKDWIIEDIKEAIGISESGFLVKINGYYNYIDSTWLNKRGVKADIIRRPCAGDTVIGSLPLKWNDKDMINFAERFKEYTDNPTGKEALEIWKDWIELKDSDLDKSFVFNSNDRNKIKTI